MSYSASWVFTLGTPIVLMLHIPGGGAGVPWHNLAHGPTVIPGLGEGVLERFTTHLLDVDLDLSTPATLVTLPLGEFQWPLPYYAVFPTGD